MTGITDSLVATISSGPMLAAMAVAALAGFVSFASPCVLPLVPGYVGYLTGMVGAVEDLPRPAQRRRLLAGVTLFILGFSAVFVTFGVAAGSLGAVLGRHLPTIARVLGVAVILLGLAFLGYLPWLANERKLRIKPAAGLAGAPLLGITFGLGWSACIGPTLAAVLTLSLNEASALRGGILAAVYCLGLGLPFALIAAGFGWTASVNASLRKHRRAIMRFGGGLLVAIGVALVTGWWQVLMSWLTGLIASFVPVL